MSTKHFVSVIIPCRNEEKYIRHCLDSVALFDYPNIEVIVVDGDSDDRTKEIVDAFAKEHTFVKLIENPDKTVPFGMNKGIREAKGDIIVRLDAHSAFPSNYITQLLHWSDKLNADNVGGVVETLPANESLKARAIALAMSSSFGVGNSYFRVGTDHPIEVDTVPFGCYKKEVFDKIGLYDEELTRNQDDELNARLIEQGGSIWLIPEIRITYHARPTYRDIYHMFFQYGYFKPLVNLKLSHPSTIRQFIPPLFVLFLILGFVGSFINSKIALAYISVLAVYFAANLYTSSALAWKEHDLRLIPYLIFAFVTIHVRYGYGYLKGIWDFIILKRRKKDMKLSR